LKVTAVVSFTAELFRIPCIGIVFPSDVLKDAVTLPKVSTEIPSDPLFKNAPFPLKFSFPFVIASRVVTTPAVKLVAAPLVKLVSVTFPSVPEYVMVKVLPDT